MILIVYDPDIAVFAERCLHDGDASAINSSIVSSGNKVILRHCLISKPYDKDPAEKDCDGVTGKENSCKPYEEESCPYQYGKEQLSFQRQRCRF